MALVILFKNAIQLKNIISKDLKKHTRKISLAVLKV